MDLWATNFQSHGLETLLGKKDTGSDHSQRINLTFFSLTASEMDTATGTRRRKDVCVYIDAYIHVYVYIKLKNISRKVQQIELHSEGFWTM